MNNSITIISIALLVGLMPFFTSCDADDDGTEPGLQGLNSGFLIISTVPGNTFIRYTTDLPSGTFDVAAGESFDGFAFRDQLGAELLVESLSSSQGVEKLIVNESGVLQSVENIATFGDAFPVHIADQNTAYYSDANNIEELVIFNPSTMQSTGSIDLSDAFFSEGADTENYGGITTRGNDLFIPYRGRKGTQFVFDSLIYHVIDRSTNSYVKTIFMPDRGEPRVFNFPTIDEQGNIYHLANGNETFPQTIRPSIVRIPAGSTDFDKSYDFQPINTIPGGDQIPLQSLENFYYGSNGIAYALGMVQLPAAVTQIINDGGGFQSLNQEQVNTILALLATEPSAAWLRIDLNAQTVNIIDGIPLSSPFVDLVTEVDGEFYFGVSNGDLNRVYRYNPDTQTSVEAFRLSNASGNLSEIIDLSKED